MKKCNLLYKLLKHRKAGGMVNLWTWWHWTALAVENFNSSRWCARCHVHLWRTL